MRKSEITEPTTFFTARNFAVRHKKKMKELAQRYGNTEEEILYYALDIGLLLFDVEQQRKRRALNKMV